MSDVPGCEAVDDDISEANAFLWGSRRNSAGCLALLFVGPPVVVKLLAHTSAIPVNQLQISVSQAGRSTSGSRTDHTQIQRQRVNASNERGYDTADDHVAGDFEYKMIRYVEDILLHPLPATVQSAIPQARPRAHNCCRPLFQKRKSKKNLAGSRSSVSL